jgi:hypothetical protein
MTILVGSAPIYSQAQILPGSRLKELRQKARDSTITPDEKAELDEAMAARAIRRQEKQDASAASGTALSAAASTSAVRETAESPERTESTEASDRAAQTTAHMTEVFDHMRELGKAAFAAVKRTEPGGPPREFYVNNETGDDNNDGLSSVKDGSHGPVKTLARGVTLPAPGDTLNLASTDHPYRETLKLGDNYGGVPGKPITIDAHGATLTGCDPLRLDGWVEAGSPGLYKSAKILSELEEFTDSAKLDRVYFLLDGVIQHMGRSSKGAKAKFKAPSDLQDNEWTYVEAEKSFYIKVAGKLEAAKVEAPYRRNGLAIRAPKAAATDVVIKNLIVCHVLNDGYNIHGATRNILLQNIAAYECGDDGISPHDVCEVELDGYWAIGNSTGMANGNLSVTKATNMHLEGNLGYQFMAAHATKTDLQNTVLVATSGNQAVNCDYNSQGVSVTMANCAVVSPKSDKIQLGPHTVFTGTHLTVLSPSWANKGEVHLTESILGGSVFSLGSGSWEGRKNIYAIGAVPPTSETEIQKREIPAGLLSENAAIFPDVGADFTKMKIPSRPLPNPSAGRFTSLEREDSLTSLTPSPSYSFRQP